MAVINHRCLGPTNGYTTLTLLVKVHGVILIPGDTVLDQIPACRLVTLWQAGVAILSIKLALYIRATTMFTRILIAFRRPIGVVTSPVKLTESLSIVLPGAALNGA
jgi:hypothetical protein